jgi:murein L,D-transpeptidase YafK
MSIGNVVRLACAACLSVLLGGCPLGGGGGIAPALKQLPAATQVLLAKKGMTQEEPILVRIFKEESELEIWKQKSDGRYYHFKTYPICTWSGELGPKVVEGDKQAPEGFYTVTPGQMNPNSQFHLAFNLGYPNSYDKVNGRTGSALMVHGDCRSAGCFAMTDALIEEIYALAREAFRGGQEKFNVHVFPFRMTDANMKRHRKSKWYRFWKTLKVGYDDFELSRIPPKVTVCSRQYLVNAEFLGHVARPDPASTCPAYRRVPSKPFTPAGGDGQLIQAKAPEAATPATSHLAANIEPNQTRVPRPVPAARASEPQRKATERPSRGAASSQPVVTARSSGREPSAERRERPIIPAGFVASRTPQATQSAPDSSDLTPTAAVSTDASAEDSEDAKTEAGERVVEAKPADEAPGLQNVQESSKGDMLVPNR